MENEYGFDPEKSQLHSSDLLVRTNNLNNLEIDLVNSLRGLSEKSRKTIFNLFCVHCKHFLYANRYYDRCYCQELSEEDADSLK